MAAYKSPAEIAYDQLVTDGVIIASTTADWSGFLDREPEKPFRCITIYNTGGSPPGHYLNRTEDRPPFEYPTIQIRVRGTTHSEAWSKIDDAVKFLEAAATITEAAGVLQDVEWFKSNSLGPPISLPSRHNDNFIFTVNIQMFREVTYS